MMASTSEFGSPSEPVHAMAGGSAALPLTPARIAQVYPETPTVRVLWLEYGAQAFRFEPGQWVDLYVDLEGERHVGGYSITSTASTPGRIRIAVKEADHHLVSRWLAHRARPGDVIALSQGQGHFHYVAGHGNRLVMLAGGIGITPLVGIIHQVCETRPQVQMSLLHSITDETERLFGKELDDLAATRANFQYLTTLSRATGVHWQGSRGRVLEVLDTQMGIDRAATYYLCGPRGFVDEVSAGLVVRGVAGERLVFERWW